MLYLVPGDSPAVHQTFRLLSVSGSPTYLLPHDIHQSNLPSLVAYLPCLVSSGGTFGLSSLYSYSCGFFFSISAGSCVFLIHPLLVTVPCFVRLFTFLLPGLSSRPILLDLLHSFRLEAPSVSSRVASWGLPGILQFLRLVPFEPLASSSFHDLTWGALFFSSPWPRLSVWAGSRRFLVLSPFRARPYICPFFLNFERRLCLRPILCLVLSVSGLWRTLSGTFLMNFSFALGGLCFIIFIVLPPWCLSCMLSSFHLVGLLMRCPKTL